MNLAERGVIRLEILVGRYDGIKQQSALLRSTCLGSA